jgi:hypothetical protein
LFLDAAPRVRRFCLPDDRGSDLADRPFVDRRDLADGFADLVRLRRFRLGHGVVGVRPACLTAFDAAAYVRAVRQPG